MTTSRRDILAIGAGAIAAPALAGAQGRPDDTPRWPPAEHFALWPGRPPGAPDVLPAERPTITGTPGEYRDIQLRGVARPLVGVYRPARPDGRAVLIAPGGGYEFTSQRNEGSDVALALAAFGITGFVLSYRLPGEGWRGRATVPLADAQRAMRLIRAGARRYAIDPARVGVLGFSAGGHLAGSLATQHDFMSYAAMDAADRLSPRPDFAGLMYAVSNVDAGRSHAGSRDLLLGPRPDPVMQARFAIDRNIRAGTPPLFLLHTEDDDVVPVQNSVDTFAAARAARVPVAAHFLPRGGHGFGVRLPSGEPAALWPQSFARWSANPTGAR